MDERCAQCGAVLKNATLIVELRRLAAKIHQGPDHARSVPWTRCVHPDCVRTRTVIEQAWLRAED